LERLAPPRFAAEWHVAAVRDVRHESEHATTLALDVPDWPGHVAGQHVDVRLTAEDGYQAERSYSIASAPEDPQVLLTVERLADGEVSPYLADEVRTGDPLELRGPIGGYFTWHVDDGGPLLLVGGGSGVVPLASMLRYRARAASDVRASLLVSARTRADVLFRDELVAQRDSGVDVRITRTRQAPTGWDGLTGRVDAAMLDDLDTDPTGPTRVFVCGPTGFVEHVADLLVRRGHDPHAVKAERFGPTGS
jgi:ferredoxin-NADP reductase